MKKVFTVLKLTMVVMLLAAPIATFAQPGFNSTDVDDTPIDGGISLLVLAGAGYGAKKLKERKAKQLNNQQQAIQK
jgi:hypothetical protein